LSESELGTSSSRRIILDSVNDENLVGEILSSVIDAIIDEVLDSTHRQPSIPGIVCEVVTEIIRSDNADINKEDVRKSKETKRQTVAETPKKKKVCHSIQYLLRRTFLKR
jgi:hypothetical protein